MSERVTGRIVTAAFESGDSRYDCGLENCECPDHEYPAMPAGTYITVRLDRDVPVGLCAVTVEMGE